MGLRIFFCFPIELWTIAWYLGRHQRPVWRMKDWIIHEMRYIWQLKCGQEWKLSIKIHRRSISGFERRSPSLLVRILAPQWGILTIWHLRLPPLWITLTIGRILTLNTLELSIHRFLISNVLVKRFLSLLTLDIWILDLSSLNI